MAETEKKVAYSSIPMRTWRWLGINTAYLPEHIPETTPIENVKNIKVEPGQTANVTRQKVISEFSSELDDLRHQAEVLNKALRMARNYYARANKSERQTLRSEILKSEQELEQLQLEIRKKEKAEQNDTLLQ